MINCEFSNISGIPYCNQKDVGIHFKKQYNNQQAQVQKAKHYELQRQNKERTMKYILDGSSWYNQQAYRALNQALGRCIRHKYDYGCIIFLESRFYGHSKYAKSNVDQLSKWVRPYMRNTMTVKMAITDLIQPYFEYMNKNPPRKTEPGQTKWRPPFEMPSNPWSDTMINPYHKYCHNRNIGGNNNINNNNKRVNYNNINNNHHLTQPYRNNNNNNQNTNNHQNGSLTQGQAVRDNRGGFKFQNHNKSISPPNTNRFFNNANGNDRKRFSFDNARQQRTNQSTNSMQQSQMSTNSRSTITTTQTMSTASSSPSSSSSYDRPPARKRKYNEIQKENMEPMHHKRARSNLYTNTNTDTEPNCIQCKCGAMICRGNISTVALDRGKGQMMDFQATKQPWPCDTADNCIWSSQLGLCFMYKKCDSCDKSIGFHVVAASTQNRLQYVGHILFLKTAVNLLHMRQ